MSGEKVYWFRAKTYGWGWGLPCTWQGWVVLGAAALLMCAAPIVFPPSTDPVMFHVALWSVVLLLVATCWIKGEPPRWRWGK